MSSSGARWAITVSLSRPLGRCVVLDQFQFLQTQAASWCSGSIRLQCPAWSALTKSRQLEQATLPELANATERRGNAKRLEKAHGSLRSPLAHR